MPTLEEITYNAGRDGLAQQESLVAGIRQRTGSLLAAHALVVSFLGTPVIRDDGLVPLAWLALAALVMGLVVSAVLLAPWTMRFTVDADVLYTSLHAQAAAEAEAETLEWLAIAGHMYHDITRTNVRRVRWLSRCSGLLAALMVTQALAWTAALAVT